MLPTMFYQPSLVRVDPDSIGLPRSSFERGLPDVLRRKLQADDFAGFHPKAQGAPCCCPRRLTAMLLLQARYNLSDRQVIERCQRDLGFRFAMELVGREKAPGITSLRRFRSWLRVNKGTDWLFRLSLQIAKDSGLLGDVGLQAFDSTNTECRGAVIDTFNLIAVAIGRVVRFVARCLGSEAAVLAKKWGLSQYLARSIKGRAAIDWSSEAQRNALLTAEIRDADRLPGLVRSLNATLPVEVDEALALVATVARQDVEQLPDGSFRIARGTASGRKVSVTDPEASHGRKSSSKAITGFKTHVAGTIESQFVTGLAVTDAATHDARVTRTLIERTEAVGAKPTEALADAAYGSAANRHACREVGVSLRAKLPSVSQNALAKRDFVIDTDAKTVTCPTGHTVKTYALVKDPGGSDLRVPQFRFPTETCRACPLKDTCCSRTANGRGRLITLNAYEEELQQAQAYNATPEAKATMRKRSGVERLISHLVRMGMRHARFFGMHMVELQAHLTAAAYNLQRYFTLTTT